MSAASRLRVRAIAITACALACGCTRESGRFDAEKTRDCIQRAGRVTTDVAEADTIQDVPFDPDGHRFVFASFIVERTPSDAMIVFADSDAGARDIETAIRAEQRRNGALQSLVERRSNAVVWWASVRVRPEARAMRTVSRCLR